MNFGAGTLSGKAENQMDWHVNNAFKIYKDMEPKSMMDMSLLPHIESMDITLSPSEKGNATPQAKPRKKTMTSVYLKFFETATDGKSRRCKFCGQSYSIATATGNLGRHLSNRHPGYDKPGNVLPSSSTSQSTMVTLKKSQPPTKATQVDYDHLNWLLVRWLVLASLPPSTLEEQCLASSFKFLNPSFQLWPSDKYKLVLREVFRCIQEDVMAYLVHVSSKVSIILDFWDSYEQICFMSVTCQWIDDNWEFQKVLLDICRISYPSGGSEVYHCLINILKMYNIVDRVLSCTHDNSQRAIHACHTLKEELDAQKIGPFCYIPCAARTLNLMIDDALRTTKVISKIREFALELNASKEISEDFVQLTTAYHEGSWKFPLDTSARWSGNYLMLDIACKAGKSMDGVIRKYEEALGSNLQLSTAEKNAVMIIQEYLEPFYKTTTNICTNKVPTIGLVLFFMDHISETITLCRESRHSPDWLKNTAEDMAKKARSYSSQVCSIFTYMTAILDPRIKSELIPENLNSGTYLEEARAHFIRNYSTGQFSSMNIYGAQEIEDGGNVSFVEEIARKKRRANMTIATDELTQYLSESPAPLLTDVFEWWKVNSTRYPRLSMMARDFLAMQPISIAPEDIFCSKADEIDKQRKCMPYESTQAIFCIRSWTQGRFKLKYQSTEIDYERLMELSAAAAADNGFLGFDRKQK